MGQRTNIKIFMLKKKFFSTAFSTFFNGKINFFLQAFINEAHQQELAFRAKFFFFFFCGLGFFNYKVFFLFGEKLKAFVRLFLRQIPRRQR